MKSVQKSTGGSGHYRNECVYRMSIFSHYWRLTHVIECVPAHSGSPLCFETLLAEWGYRRMHVFLICTYEMLNNSFQRLYLLPMHKAKYKVGKNGQFLSKLPVGFYALLKWSNQIRGYTYTWGPYHTLPEWGGGWEVSESSGVCVFKELSINVGWIRTIWHVLRECLKSIRDIFPIEWTFPRYINH